MVVASVSVCERTDKVLNLVACKIKINESSNDNLNKRQKVHNISMFLGLRPGPELSLGSQGFLDLWPVLQCLDLFRCYESQRRLVRNPVHQRNTINRYINGDCLMN